MPKINTNKNHEFGKSYDGASFLNKPWAPFCLKTALDGIVRQTIIYISGLKHAARQRCLCGPRPLS
jgi:hypothetical protein